ncbi:MAG: transcriptional regulator [Alphaproteobacteria bacterium]|nr:transcriptional regulator [Alphaproteobacteria bacterium]
MTLGKDIIKGLNDVIQSEKSLLTADDGVRIYRYKTPTPEEVDVKAIRDKLQMTQEQFSLFGFSKRATRHGEHHRRIPDGAARVLLKVIEHYPEVVLHTIKTA